MLSFRCGFGTLRTLARVVLCVGQRRDFLWRKVERPRSSLPGAQRDKDKDFTKANAPCRGKTMVVAARKLWVAPLLNYSHAAVLRGD